MLLVYLYVDDITSMGISQSPVDNFKLRMVENFEMIDLRVLQHFLRLEVMQEEMGIFLGQKCDAKKKKKTPQEAQYAPM